MNYIIKINHYVQFDKFKLISWLKNYYIKYNLIPQKYYYSIEKKNIIKEIIFKKYKKKIIKMIIILIILKK